MQKHIFVENRFFASAGDLRKTFDRRFRDPKETRPDRFVWDYWHVPNQYTFVRTPADHFFPAPLYRAFLKRLTDWSRETLGCQSLTPPWLSYYVEGCEQQLHSDLPHGPWAYVFSLSPPRRKFTGGETLLLRPETLDYWRHFRDSGDRERAGFVRTIAPDFNRLVVFDPRIPHGVTRVGGTLDPREGRLVVHGWFTDPAPYLLGGLSAAKAAPVLDEAVGRFMDAIRDLGQWHGTVSIWLEVSSAGRCAPPRILADTLVPADADPADARRLRTLLKNSFHLRFPKAAAPTKITLPLLFR